ncbi:MAG: cell division protein FtsK [Flavobacteriaceae bacterium]|nr:cell division protein FtsK [Flavobacteriaceae bacterium]
MASGSKKVSKKKKIEQKAKRHRLFGAFLIVISISLFISFVSYFQTWKIDQSAIDSFNNRGISSENWMKKIGAQISHFFIHKGFGAASFIFNYLLFITGGVYILERSKERLFQKWFWGSVFCIWLSIFFGFAFSQNPILSGAVGIEWNLFLEEYIGKIGVFFTLMLGAFIMAVLLFDFNPQNTLEKITQSSSFFEKIGAAIHRAVAALPKFKPSKSTIDSIQNETEEITENHEEFNPETEEITEEIPQITFDINASNDGREVHPLFASLQENKEATEEKPAEKEQTTEDKNNPELELDFKPPTIEESIDLKAKELVQEHGTFNPTLELKNFQMPHLDLLKDYSANQTQVTIDKQKLNENKDKIVETLRNYKIGISNITATIGPTVTLYEIVPEAGVRISKIKNLEDDIALSLSALGIRIIAPIPGKGTIGIEVPNEHPSIVSMKSVIASKKFQTTKAELPIAFGKTISNETMVVDLAKMPHMLMAGATGQGKSVGLNAVITSLLYKKHPAEIKFVLVDPKKVELTLYNKIERHYLAKLPDSEEAIITDTTKVIHTLNSLCIEMDERYELLKDAMVRNIKEYNEKFVSRKLNPNEGHRYLPYIILVIDEFADLIMTAGKEVETPIARLAQLARAIGIHLIIATQRPSVNVITGLIKANFPARIAFRVTSKIDSRTILDAPGADQLIGRGDMLFTQGSENIRIQCAFVDTPEVDEITSFIGNQRAYPDAHKLPEYVDDNTGTILDDNIEERDKLFRQAAEVVVTAQQGSASLIQRKLKIGYNRAGRIIDQLEAAGIVGPFEGSKARQVLIPDLIALEDFFNNEKQA